MSDAALQQVSGAGGPSEAIITGISTRMVYRPGVSGRYRDGRARPSRADDGHAGGEQGGPGQDRGDAEQHVAEVRLLGQITSAAAMMS